MSMKNKSQDLMGIGEFSRLSGISVRTLRYYGEEGILSPAQVKDNRYRYYSGLQLTDAERMTVYREVGMPISLILRVVQGSCTELDAMCEQEKTLLKEMEEKEKTLSILRGLIKKRQEAAVRYPEGEKVLPDGSELWEDLPWIGDTFEDGFTVTAVERIPPASEEDDYAEFLVEWESGNRRKTATIAVSSGAVPIYMEHPADARPTPIYTYNDGLAGEDECWGKLPTPNEIRDKYAADYIHGEGDSIIVANAMTGKVYAEYHT